LITNPKKMKNNNFHIIIGKKIHLIKNLKTNNFKQKSKINNNNNSPNYYKKGNFRKSKKKMIQWILLVIVMHLRADGLVGYHLIKQLMNVFKERFFNKDHILILDKFFFTFKLIFL